MRMRTPRAFSVWWASIVAGAAFLAAPQAFAQPVAVDDSYATSAGVPLNVADFAGVLKNDTGTPPLAAVLVSSVSNGALLLGTNGGFFYLPNIGFTGNDSFTYQASSGPDLSNVATVTINVTPPGGGNAPPVAANDTFTTAEDEVLNVGAASGVLANDTDANANPLTAVLVGNVSSGTLTLQANGSLSYTPAPDFNGTATFTYQADDGSVRSNTATATITVTAVADPPAAQADSYATNEGQTLNVNANNGVLDNDTDPDSTSLTAVLVTDVANGTLSLQANGSFSYTPPAGFSGTTTFAYLADDGTARSATATVTISVTAVNEAPTAESDSYTTAEDTPLNVAANGVLDNDTDPDGDTLTAQLTRNVANGTLQLNANGSFVYTPPTNFNGTTTFQYRAHDASAQSAATTVTITVTAANDAPVITNSPPTTATEGVTYSYALAASDPDGTTPTISAPTLPAWLRFTPPATISGTPAEADVGTHSVTMSVTDGVAPAVTATFQIAVQGVDSPPSIAPIPEQTATENTPFEVALAPFVTDTDTAAASLTYAATDGVPAGLTLSADGRLSGTPQIAASVGTHTVRFTVSDAENTVPGLLTLAVLPAGRVDLSVAMNASPSPVALEAPTRWTITVTNRAPQVAADGVTLEATFAGEVPFQFDAPPTICTLAPSGDQTLLTCSLGRLAGGASTTVTLTGHGSFAGDVFAGTRVAVGQGGAFDETPANDSATASLSIAQRIAGVPAQRIALENPRAAAAADFDGDGFDELAVATASAQGLVLFANVADPANPGRRVLAAPPQVLGGEALATDVAIADLDRDGDLDIVTAAGNGAPNRAYLRSNGTFTSTSLGDAAVESRAVTAADVNGDAFVDLVFANPGTSTVLVNTGSGGTFTPAAGVGPHDARDALLVDLFGDTLPELVLANGDGGAAVYRNTRGAFTLETTLATGPTSAVAAGDFNADNRADLAFARDTATLPEVPSALVWLNTSGTNGQLFVSDELGAATTTGLLVHDFDLDSRTDVLALNGSGVRIFTNDGAANGKFALHPQQLATPAARGAAAGKLSNDDRIDLAVVGDGVAVFVNDGAGNFGQPDTNAPVIQLRGEPTVNITIDAPYTDAGATATDKEDGDITSRIVVTSSVDNTVLGTYTVTYAVTDLSGNAAAPVTRTVTVQPQAAAEEGGSGAFGLETLAALLLAAALALRRRPARRA